MLETPIFKFALRKDLANDLQFLPSKGEPLATGYDVRAAHHDKSPMVIRAGEYFKIPLGFRSFCPPGWYYQLHPRSSTFAKKQIHNLIGIVDESWEGETLFAGQYLPEEKGSLLRIDFGERIGQIIPVKREEVEMKLISNEEYDLLCSNRQGSRGDGGFGSTGVK